MKKLFVLLALLVLVSCQNVMQDTPTTWADTNDISVVGTWTSTTGGIVLVLTSDGKFSKTLTGFLDSVPGDYTSKNGNISLTSGWTASGTYSGNSMSLTKGLNTYTLTR